MTEVSSTRLYLGNLPRNATKNDVENHFATHGTGKITEIKLMNGFGFIEYEDALDARDVVPAFHGTDFMGERLTVQFARGSRPRDPYAPHERSAPRPRRTQYRMQISGLPIDTSWQSMHNHETGHGLMRNLQDLKDFARQSGLDVVYSETGRDRDGRGFVEYENGADLRTAVEKLDNHDFKGARVHCVADIQEQRPARDRYRSRSPSGARRGAAPVADDYYDRRAPRGFSPPPRRYDYRERSPGPRRDYYYDPRDRYPRSPPSRPRGPPEDYPAVRRPYPDDPYAPRRYEPDPYMNGHARPYDRPPSPRRPRSPRGGYDAYDRRAYW
ncbi:RNA-binding domain-containing protein [Xylona heveae TC161]|uniref:RNA-binding domain-containing protein n=1 Tax=Xylona heveae (strain CBS 132557 / TC161) TaxID=1328760 RepID=A0A165GR82_XYLHT|nr:RNA-binding domain-containing protein [Xylona heveae TC161]KZF22493.1 RNA-binding domain-containing protein [Xylona heveae TC161]